MSDGEVDNYDSVDEEEENVGVDEQQDLVQVEELTNDNNHGYEMEPEKPVLENGKWWRPLQWEAESNFVSTQDLFVRNLIYGTSYHPR